MGAAPLLALSIVSILGLVEPISMQAAIAMAHGKTNEVNVSTEDDGVFKVEVLFADTQNRMEQGRKRRRDIKRAADALVTAISDELLKLVME
jgi:hypothetical protein